MSLVCQIKTIKSHNKDTKAYTSSIAKLLRPTFADLSQLPLTISKGKK